MGRGHSPRIAHRTPSTTSRCIVCRAPSCSPPWRWRRSPTVVGLVALWPDGARVDELRSSARFAAPGTTFPDAVVDRVEPPCEQDAAAGGAGTDEQTRCGRIHATVASGPDQGTLVRVDVPPEGRATPACRRATGWC